MCEQPECRCGETDLSDEDSDSNAETDMRMHAARVEDAMQQLAQAEYSGFSKDAIRRAVSIVGPSNPQGIVEWLIQSEGRIRG